MAATLRHFAVVAVVVRACLRAIPLAVIAAIIVHSIT